MATEYTDTLVVSSNDVGSPLRLTVKVSVVANTAQLEFRQSGVAVDTVDVGDAWENEFTDTTITLKNVGGVLLSITSATVSGSHFSMVSGPASLLLGPNGETTITVRVSGTTTYAEVTGELTVTHSGVNSPTVCALTGFSIGFHAYAIRLETNIASQASTLPLAQKKIASTLMRAMEARSSWNKIVLFYPMLGDGIVSCLTPIIYNLARGFLTTNVDFVDSDFSLSGGLQGQGDATATPTKCAVAPLAPSQMGVSNQFGIGAWCLDGVPDGTFFTQGWFCGVLGEASPARLDYAGLTTVTTSPSVTFYGSSTTGALPGTDPEITSAWGNDMFYGQRQQPSNRTLYQNGVLVSSSSVANTYVAPGYDMMLMALETDFDYPTGPRGPIRWCQNRIGMFIFTDGTLTDQESADLYSDIRTNLMIPTGRVS